jgi:galactoside O-acetyltransferase
MNLQPSAQIGSLRDLARRWKRRLWRPAATPAPVPVPASFRERYAAHIQAGPNTHFLNAASLLTGPGSVERVRLRLGQDTLIDCRFLFDSAEADIQIGDRCYIAFATDLHARSGITIGDDVVISWSCRIYDHNAHSMNWRHRQEDMRLQLENLNRGLDMLTNKNWSTVATAPITIEDKAWLGFEVVVMKGVTIGEGAVVGARSVVTHDVPAWTVVAGNPARFVREIPLSER